MRKQKLNLQSLRREELFPFGIYYQNHCISVSIPVFFREKIQFALYRIGETTPIKIFSFSQKDQVGSVLYFRIVECSEKQYTYCFFVDQTSWIPPYATQVIGREVFGKPSKFQRAVISMEQYQWKFQNRILRPYEEVIAYRLHVRGFTKEDPSVEAKGCFLGLTEKIPYLKWLGVNTIELLPAYEFNEVMPYLLQTMNYWGYTKDAYYLAPKSAYAKNPLHVVQEYKQMIELFHQNQMEIIMEFYFDANVSKQFVLDCLHYWVLEYHIDGFRMNQEAIDPKELLSDPILSGTKLWLSSWGGISQEMLQQHPYLAQDQDAFLVNMRKFLKSDGGQVEQVASCWKKKENKIGTINHITTTNGFTLWDLFSYNTKHNEANGESGKDGTDWNFSWNCGVEGPTKRKKVLFLRKKQVKNALVLLLLSQGVPSILAGDEFGNSQNGNNNAYCQDNSIAWLNWEKQEKEILSFTQKLIQLRKNYAVFHQNQGLIQKDYFACGYPDISMHGVQAWSPDYTEESRCVAFLLPTIYAEAQEQYFYLLFNFYWKEKTFDLPDLPKAFQWFLVIDTNQTAGKEIILEEQLQKAISNQREQVVAARSILVLLGKKTDREEEKHV